jgi:predicted HicB family RNase H-like nuclease
MPRVDITMEAKAPEVNMFMSDELCKKIRAAAEKRDVSLNVIVNSAMAQWLSKKGLVDIRPL